MAEFTVQEAALMQASREMGELTALLNSSGWALVRGEWLRCAAEYDQALHRESPEQVARMAALQAMYRTLHEVQRTPEALIARREAQLREAE